MACHGISQGLSDDGSRRHYGRDAAAGVRDRSRRRSEVRVRREPAGTGGPLGAHVVPRLRRAVDRAVRLRHQATANRRRRAVRDVRSADSWRVVVTVLSLMVVRAVQVGSAPAPPPARPSWSAATFDPLVVDGIRRGAYPGAALIIGRRDTVLFAKGYGHLTWSAGSAS